MQNVYKVVARDLRKGKTMSDYISREEADHKLEIAFLGLDKRFYGEAKSLFNGIPSADVRPNIHGHWGRRIVDNGFNADWVCSECGHREYTDFIHMNFCPNCGADMREPKGEKGTE